MSVVDTPPASVADAPGARRSFDGHRGLRLFGLACLMGAAFFGGYVAWLLWGTGVETRVAQQELRAGIETSVDHPRPPAEAPAPGTVQVPGSAYAIIQIPSIDLDFVVVEGTDYTSLKKGPGHYPDTADPWDMTGRVGIAGHRTTYLHPFFDLDEVAVGAEIRLLTGYGTYVYEVDSNLVIPETGSGVVLEQTKEPTLVLTTCNPKYSSYQRLIVTADLVRGPRA